jgi:hypothetical protein
VVEEQCEQDASKCREIEGSYSRAPLQYIDLPRPL